jgi:hypothetical protein
MGARQRNLELKSSMEVVLKPLIVGIAAKAILHKVSKLMRCGMQVTDMCVTPRGS